MVRPGVAGRLVVACVVVGVLFGCGGGRSGSSGGGGGGLPEPTYSGGGRSGAGTAQFRVDLSQGTVEVTPLSGSATSRAVFSGAAVTFNSQLVLDQPGSNGLRQVNVSLANHWSVPIGQSPDGSTSGLRVLFSPFVNLTGTPDVRSQVFVSTVPGTVGGPFGIAAAIDGTLFASSFSNLSIMQLSGGTATKLAGAGGPGMIDDLGGAAAFAYPCGLVLGPMDSALYLADYNNRRIRRIDRSGRVTTIAGTSTSGTADGAGNVATFTNPIGLAATSSDLWVTDYAAGNVRRVHLTSGADPALAASWTVSTVVTGLTVPVGIAAASDSLLYVAEVNANRIRQVSLGGGANVLAGGGAEGGTDGPASSAQFAIPYGLAWTGSGLVVSEYHSARLRLLRPTGGAVTDPANWQVLTLAGDASATGTADGDGTVARFSGLKMVTADPGGGAVYVADGNNNRVRKVILPQGLALGSGPSSPAMEPVTLANASGLLPNPDWPAPRPYIDYQLVALGLLPGQTTSPKPWQFVVPSGVNAFTFTVTVEAATSTLAAPEAGSGVASAKVVISTLAGASGNSYYPLDGPAATARFGGAQYVAVDGLGTVYVSDSGNHALRRIGRDGTVTTIAGGIGSGAVDGLGTAASLNDPQSLVVNRQGTVLYVADCNNNTIRRVALLTGNDPRLAASWNVATIAGSSSGSGNTNGAGNLARFSAPAGLCQVSDLLLYVSELNGNRVRRLQFAGGNADTAANWQVSAVAGDTGGAGGYVDGTGSAARFTSPSGLAAGPDGVVYVADTGNERIRRVMPDGTVSTVAGGSSTPDYVDGPAATARFDYPSGVAIDAGGQLYVADTYNYRIRRVSPAGQVTTVAGGGSTVWDGPGNVGKFEDPVSVAVDASGTLYVGENGAVRKIERLLDTTP